MFHTSMLIRARRLMIAGLVASVFGNYVINAGFSTLTAIGAIATSLLVLLKTLEQIVVFFFPLYAKLLARYSPDKSLILVDFLEGAFSLIGLLLILTDIFDPVIVIAAYVLIDIFLAPITDIAEEYYGLSLAKVDEQQALSFNAWIYSILALVGFSFGGPLGSWLSAVSIPILLSVNVVLSFIGAGFRSFARHTIPVSSLLDADPEDFAVTGSRMPISEFVADLFKSGPASPLLSFIIRIASALTGELFLLWVAMVAANLFNQYNAFTGMGVVLLVFGVAASIGPQLGKYARKTYDTGIILRVSALFMFAITSGFAGYLNWNEPNPYIALLFVALAVTVNRARIIVLETHRQILFKGSQFMRVMSWSFSFGALGTMVGLQLGYFLDLPHSPQISLLIASCLWLAISFVIRTPRKQQ